MEFVSKLEEIMPAEELNFEPAPAFGIYKRYLDHAVTHPAKTNTELLKFLILKYTKEGDVILDPMAGSYSTCVVAYCLRRSSIGVDVEEKFYNWGLEAKRKVEKAVTVKPKPKITVLKGDARRLSGLLNQAGFELEAIITSPPYLNVDNVKKNCEDFWRKAKEGGNRWGSKPPKGTDEKQTTSSENIGNLPLGDVNTGITSLLYELSTSPRLDWAPSQRRESIIRERVLHCYHPENPENVGNMKLGNVDTIITSPPYAEAKFYYGKKSPEFWVKLAEKTGRKAWTDPNSQTRKTITEKEAPDSASKENIGNMPLGEIDIIITSPPYSEGQHNYKHGLKTLGDNFKGRRAWKERRDIPVQKDNIAKLKHGDVDAIITSPPYSGTRAFQDLDFMERVAGEQSMRVKRGEVKGHYMSEKARKRVFERMRRGSMGSKDNIGNLQHGEIGAPSEINTTPSDEEIGVMVRRLMKGGKPTYLSEMLRIYREMWRVLKLGGIAIIIVKPFVKEKKVVDLPYHTWLLLQAVGFKLEKLYKRRLQQESFWRVLYKKKHSNVPEIRHEHIIIAKKPV